MNCSIHDSAPFPHCIEVPVNLPTKTYTADEWNTKDRQQNSPNQPVRVLGPKGTLAFSFGGLMTPCEDDAMRALIKQARERYLDFDRHVAAEEKRLEMDFSPN